jgi:hypothetical protein
MSEEVAGGIPEFAPVLKDMKAVRPMVENVCASMDQAGADLNAALGGETPKDLAQNTTNAALAYTTLQKQNSLATRFIDTADEYLTKADADDRLKFVRDQWVEYQQLTAILDKDEEAAAELEKKGRVLTPDQALAAVQTFDVAQEMPIVNGITLSEQFGVESNSFLQAQGSVAYLQNIANEVYQQSVVVDGVQQSVVVDGVQQNVVVDGVQQSVVVDGVQQNVVVDGVQQNVVVDGVQQNTGVTVFQHNTGTGNLAHQIGFEVFQLSVCDGMANLQHSNGIGFLQSTNIPTDVISNTITGYIQNMVTGDVVSQAVIVE